MPEDSSGRKITYLLEMSAESELRPKHGDSADLEITQVRIACPEYNWFLQQAVGADYRWGGREDWDRRQWTEYVDRPELNTWVAYVSGTPAGYFELESREDGSVQIQLFGLLSGFIGKGLGGILLTEAARQAWMLGANRVWLTTCSHDHAHALPNYLSRGFRIVRESAGPANPVFESSLFSTRGHGSRTASGTRKKPGT